MSKRIVYTANVDGDACTTVIARNIDEAREILSDWNVHSDYADIEWHTGPIVDAEDSGITSCTRAYEFGWFPYIPGNKDFPGNFNCKRDKDLYPDCEDCDD